MQLLQAKKKEEERMLADANDTMALAKNAFMEVLILLIIAIGLAMDSVTVSISCALILYKFNFKFIRLF